VEQAGELQIGGKMNLQDIVAPELPRNPGKKVKKFQAVMRRLRMVNSESNFKHPSLPAGHPLEEHVLYIIRACQWKNVSQQGR